MKIGFYTLGCKLNQAETDEIKEKLLKAGFKIASNPYQAQLVILGACGVTINASQRTRQMIRAFKRKGAKVFVMGCLENKIPEIDFYSQNPEKIFQKIKEEQLLFPQKTTKKSPEKISNFLSKNSFKEKARAFIKIQTGCNFHCTFCLSRQFRGLSQSVDPTKILNQIKEKIKKGYQEIVLTGLNLALYRWPNFSCFKAKQHFFTLVDLVEKILQETEIARIRFGSIDPRLITPSFIQQFQNPRLCPHLHLSLQSGSNKILKTMNRNYTSEDCLTIIKKFRTINPFFSFTTDIIVGFPGETEKDFQATCQLIRKAKFLKVHIFPFSPRPNTKAQQMPNQISPQIKKERLIYLQKIAEISRQEYLKKILGEKRPVLFEEKRHNRWEGYTPEFIRIGIPSEKNLKGKIEEIKIIPQVILPQ